MNEIVIIEVDYNSVLLGWNKIENCIEYELQILRKEKQQQPQEQEEKEIKEEENEWKTLSSTIKGTTIRKKNLNENEIYLFRIRSHLNDGWDLFSLPITVQVLSSQIKTINPPILKSRDNQSITIEWEPIDNMIGYKLRYREENNLSWHYIDSIIHSNIVKKKGLQSNISYYFSILPISSSIEEQEEWQYSRSSQPITLLQLQLSPFISQLFPKDLLDSNQLIHSTLEALSNKVIAVYFSAHWCPPCRAFTPKLISVYQQSKELGKQFEVIFCSADHSEEEFFQYFKTMPWLAIKFNDEEREIFMSKFSVSGIPKLSILAPSGQIIVDNAVNPNINLQMIDQWIHQAGL